MVPLAAVWFIAGVTSNKLVDALMWRKIHSLALQFQAAMVVDRLANQGDLARADGFGANQR